MIQWPWWQVFLTLRQIAHAARSQTEAAAGDRSSAALEQPVSRPALEASSGPSWTGREATSRGASPSTVDGSLQRRERQEKVLLRARCDDLEAQVSWPRPMPLKTTTRIERLIDRVSVKFLPRNL
ncbi:unnamed protein product [Protopolystoma xenopodis]|uniref:Secreted protein n=1 Tax=Protopolystoma xenopodis TaxID=117903 RepID=A0A448X4F3_9PLAT|nr:unnamed protein product [Protopolystoma xenopodis]